MSKGRIHLNPAHKGMLHRDLGVPQGQPIPASKLEQATHSSNPAIAKRAQFAENAKHFDHKGTSSHGNAVKSMIQSHGKGK